MDNNKISIKDGRKQLAALGYKLKAAANPFKPELKSLAFIGGDMKSPQNMGDVFSRELHDNHAAAIAIMNQIEPNSDKSPNV